MFAQLPLTKQEIKETGMIWVSWPKKASNVATDVTEDLTLFGRPPCATVWWT